MHKRTSILIIVLVAVAGSIWLLESRKASPGSGNGEIVTIEPMSIEEKDELYEPALEITNPSGFINTSEDGITIGELIGKKVILVDFWTYSCINCQRTLPFLNAWYDKYRDQGLEIIGIHTPEFKFEEEYENVLAAVEKYEIEYPVVQDNEYSTWRAYGNRYWPRKYLIDIDGYIVYDHIGEGSYEETEARIQELLAERAVRLGEDTTITRDTTLPDDVEVVDRSMPRTPEIYFGADRNEYFGNGTQGQTGEMVLTTPSMPLLDMFYLDGTWHIDEEYATNIEAGARIVLPYRAGGVFMVAQAENPVTITVLIDGKPIPEELRGRDVQADGTLIVQEEDLYRIVEGDAWEQHTLELKIQDGGLDVYTFTFG